MLHHCRCREWNARLGHQDLAAQFSKPCSGSNSAFVGKGFECSDCLFELWNPLFQISQFRSALLKFLNGSKMTRFVGVDVNVSHGKTDCACSVQESKELFCTNLTLILKDLNGMDSL